MTEMSNFVSILTLSLKNTVLIKIVYFISQLRLEPFERIMSAQYIFIKFASHVCFNKVLRSPTFDSK